MRRGKRVLENENMFIYVGTAIFILLAIALGIIMYMTTRTGVRKERNVAQEQQVEVQGETESVTSEIGKTVEEQTENIISNDDGRGEGDTSASDSSTQVNTQLEQRAQEENVIQEQPEAITPVEEPTKNEITFVKPTEGEIICEYAKDNLIYSETLKEWITHTAIDIKADKTSVIKSSADGVIKSIVNDPRYGLTVVIGHDGGYETVYSNLLTAEFIVVGEEVIQGQTIGTAGNTAAFESEMECHLHFELLKDGEYLDPSIYLK